MQDINPKIAILGLGYVGLPLAVEFGKIFHTIGYDPNKKRIKDLGIGFDETNEIPKEKIRKAKKLFLASDKNKIKDCNVFIVTVPTPIDGSKQPNLKPLKKATLIISEFIKKGDVVIYESTVYPGTTEEFCIPLLERKSQLKLNKDFYVGYSPERINPGDQKNNLSSIVKVVSGSNKDCTNFINSIYSKIINAGTFKAPSIKVAEAAKVIENTQRDVNIALMNELALIFNRMGIDTKDILEVASTKWNFLNFKPGLVGGHCISIDPYYLTHKALSIGYYPEIILTSRRINDSMGFYVANQIIKIMNNRTIQIVGSKILVMGLAFKENCRDLRNSKVFDVISELKDNGINVDVYDPIVDPIKLKKEYKISMIKKPNKNFYDGIILAVAHNFFIQKGSKAIRAFGNKKHIFFDLKSAFPKEESDIRL